MGLLEDFLSGRPENTCRAYRSDLEAFRSFIGAPSALAAIESLMQGGYSHSQAQFARYQENLLRAGKSRATTARYLAAVRSVLVHAHRQKLIAWEPPVRPPFPPAYKDTASGDVVALKRTLEQLAKETSPISIRDHAMVLLMGRMALRRAEVSALRLRDVSLEKGEITVDRVDGKPPDVLPLIPEVSVALERWIALRGREAGPFFLAARNGRTQKSGVTDRTIGRVLVRYGLASPRALRHLAITSYLERTDGDLAGAQEFGRVRRSSTLRTYERNRQEAADRP